jgi:hypothetical protein
VTRTTTTTKTTNKNQDHFDKDYLKSLQISKNVTKILDQLLKGYDKRVRPNYAGPPVVIGITSLALAFFKIKLIK